MGKKIKERKVTLHTTRMHRIALLNYDFENMEAQATKVTSFPHRHRNLIS